MSESLRLAVSPASSRELHRRLLAHLEPLLPVRITPVEAGRDGDALVMLNVDRKSVDGAMMVGHPVFACVSGSQVRQPGMIRFSPSSRLDPRLRGQRVAAPELSVVPVRPERGDDVMAFAGSEPIWIERSVNGHIVDVVGIEPIASQGHPSADETMSVVPLVHFLRRLAQAENPPQPLRACLLLDDPNLRWWTYGYVRYRELAAHAAAHGYHVSISMIPLDARFAHPGVVELLRAHPAEYSLSMQGNNHTHCELASTSSQDLLACAAQAVCRIQRFEARTGLAVDRVVVPPHGALSAEGLQAESAIGLDAVAASSWSIPQQWANAVNGMLPTVSGPEGLAILIRRHIEEHAVWSVLDSYLNRPLIVYLHHEDLRAGLDVLTGAVERIDRLGAVTWCSLGDIVQSQYGLTETDGRATVHLYAPRVAMTVPDSATRVAVLHTAPGSTSMVRVEGPGVDAVVPLGVDVTVPSGTALSIRLIRNPLDPRSIGMPPWGPWPIVRRLMTETRDRLRPLVRR